MGGAGQGKLEYRGGLLGKVGVQEGSAGTSEPDALAGYVGRWVRARGSRRLTSRS